MSDGAALPFHPLANLFPLIEGAEFDELVEDIKREGLLDQIVVYDGLVLDGRNRYRALLRLDPGFRIDDLYADDFTAYEGDDPLAFVLSKNLARRHLNESQRAMVAAKLANMRQGERTDKAAQPSANLRKVDQPTAARMLQVSPRSVSDAKAVATSGVAELVKAVEDGSAPVSAARVIATLKPGEQKRILKEIAEQPNGRRALREAAKEVRAEEQARRHVERQQLAEEISKTNPALPEGRAFPIVLIDVPRKANAYSDVTGSEKAPDNHYPTMTFRQLCDFPIDRFAARDAIIIYASTAASLLDDLEILAEWGFVSLRARDAAGKLVRDPAGEPNALQPGGRYASHQVWRKVRAGEATGMGRWFRDDHELYIVARRGDVPAPLPGTQARSVFDAPWSGHSFKPGEEVRGWIDRCWPGLSKIEVFARGAAPQGWVFWGNQAFNEPCDPVTGEIVESNSGSRAADGMQAGVPAEAEREPISRSSGETGQVVGGHDIVLKTAAGAGSAPAAGPAAPPVEAVEEIPDFLRIVGLTPDHLSLLDEVAPRTFNETMLIKKLRENPQRATALDVRQLDRMAARIAA
jgi:N6-adenosine-specific RNA methylase IME4